MNRKWVVVWMLTAGCLGIFPKAQIVSAESEQKKTGILDNDDLAKALAELGDDAPAVDAEKKPDLPAQEDPAVELPKSAVPGSETEKAEDEEPFLPRELNSKYNMLKHLPEADVQMSGTELDSKVAGVWDKDRFTFSGFPSTEIRVERSNFPAGPKPVISVKISPKQIYRIRFNDVPPFSKISLQYKLHDPAASKLLSYMYLKVFVGQYEVRRLQVSSKDSWRNAAMNVGAVSFLNQNVPVFFEFSTNQTSGLTFSFIPETE